MIIRFRNNSPSQLASEPKRFSLLLRWRASTWTFIAKRCDKNRSGGESSSRGDVTVFLQRGPDCVFNFANLFCRRLPILRDFSGINLLGNIDAARVGHG